MSENNGKYILDQLEVGAIGTNCYILACAVKKEAAVIDPGGDVDRIWRIVSDNGWKVTAIINTHSHFDHISGNLRLQALTGAPIMIHEAEAPFLGDSALNFGGNFGHQSDGGRAERLLKDGDTVKVGDLSLLVLHTPGHSPGGVSLVVENLVFVGDCLFYRSIGRTDFAGGDYGAIIKSIKEKLFLLPDQTIAYPGHGPATTIGEEKACNPYARA